MSDMIRVGVLLTDEISGEKIGVIEIDPSGMLIARAFENTVHVNSITSLSHLIKEPLYVKYSKLLAEKIKIPADILDEEAFLFSEIINQREQRFKIGNYIIKATPVRF